MQAVKSRFLCISWPNLTQNLKYARKDGETFNSLLDIYQTISTRDIKRLTPHDNSKRLNTTNYMLQKQIRNFDVKRLSFKNT